MAVVDEIAVKLGISTTEFKAALKDADATVKNFKKGGEFSDNEGFGKSIKGMSRAVGDFKALLAGGGIIGLFKELFQKGAEYADKNRGSIDENVHAMLRLKEASAGTSDTLGKAFTVVAGTMENVGLYLGGLVYGFDNAVEGANRLAEATKKTIALEEQKKYAELLKIRRDITYEEADANGKIGILVKENIERQLKLNALKKDSVEGLKLQGEIEKANAEIRKQIAEDEKNLLQEEKKQRDELKKIQDEDIKYAQESVKLDKELAKIKFEKLKPEQQVAELLKEQGKLQKEIKSDLTDENQVKRDKIRLAEIDVELEKARAKIIKGILADETAIAKKKEEQLRLIKEATLFSQGAATMYGFTIDSDPAKQRQNEQNQRQSANEAIKRELAALQAEMAKLQQSGSTSAQFLIAQLRTREEALRGRLNNDAFVFDPNYRDSLGAGVAANAFGNGDKNSETKIQTNLLTSVNDNIADLSRHVRGAFPL